MKILFFELCFDSRDNLAQFVDDGVVVRIAVFAEEGHEGFPEAEPADVEAVENDDGLAFHQVVTLLVKDHEGEKLLHGAGAAGEDDEGVGVLDHDFHAGVDVVAKPEGVEAFGEAFELDDMGDIGAGGPTSSADRTTNDGAHDAALSGTGDAAQLVIGKVATKGFAVGDVVFFFDGGGTKNADVPEEIVGDGGVGVDVHGLLFLKGLAVDGREPFIAKFFEGLGDTRGIFGDKEIVAVVLFDGAELIEMVEKLENDVPGMVVVDDDCGLGSEVFVEGLVAHKDGDGFEDVFEASAGSEDEGFCFDDLFLNVAERDLLVSIGVADVPTGVEEMKEELGTGGTIGVFGSDDGSGKANGGHE